MVADTSQGQALRFHYDGAQVEVPIEYTNPAEYAVTTDGNLREMEGGWVSLTVTRNGNLMLIGRWYPLHLRPTP